MPSAARAAVVALIGALPGCSSAAGGRALPPPPPVVDVRMTEYQYAYVPEVPSGRVVFRARNDGRIDHEVLLLELTEEFPPIDDQLKGDVRRPVNPFAGVRRRPGQSGAFAVDLVSGRRYALVCFIRDQQGQVHALRGMNSEFRAGGGRPGPSQPPTMGTSQPS